MSREIACLIFALFLGTVTTTALADPILILSSPDDLTNISIGEQIHIEVILQGVDVGNNFVFVLNSQVLFPGSLFDVVPDPSWSSGLTPGPILAVPAQADSFNAVSSLTDGLATGNFSDSAPQPSQAIAQNGVYYSFILVARAVGSGVIELDPANTQYAANSTGFNLAPLATGDPLTFAIVPEPSSLSMGCLGAIASLACLRLGRRAR